MEEQQFHLPDPSYYPILLAFGVVLLAVGVLWTPIVIFIGLTIILVAIAGWTQENRIHFREETTHDDSIEALEQNDPDTSSLEILEGSPSVSQQRE